MVKLNIYIRNHKKDTEKNYVWISFYINREKINFSTKVLVTEKHWDSIKCKVTGKDSRASDKNLIIDNIVSRIHNVFVKYRLRDKMLTRVAFIRAYNRPDDYANFFEFVADYQKKFNFKNELSTMNVHKTVLKKLKEYNSELHFDDLTTDFLDEYYAHLRRKMTNCENTAYKNLSTIRKYVRAAHKAGYLDENPFESWSIKRTKASYTYLDESELKVLLKVYSSGELDAKYHKTLEFFLFMCFSSLYIGDAKKLKLDHFTDTSFTYFRIKNKNRKPEPIVVPISDILRKILTNVVGLRKQGFIFEHLYADQTMNVFLKAIAKKYGINKSISHKTGRHTFATYFLKKQKT